MDAHSGYLEREAHLAGGFSARPPLLMVGRERERALVRAELEAATAGSGRLLLLGGEAGIGKTALAHDLARTALESGVRVAAGHCFDLSNAVPYGPWLDLCRSQFQQGAGPALPEAFRDGRLGVVSDQTTLFLDVDRFLAELAEDRPTYLLLEDLHWADPASVELLRFVARTLNRKRILAVATYRQDEIGIDHALFWHLPAMVREGNAIRLEPTRLNPAALELIISSRYLLQPRDLARLITYLARHADGNPFFATEILRALEENGLLRGDTTWAALGELDRVVVPRLLRQVIEGRVARLSKEPRRLLAIAAVIGQEVPLSVWADLAEVSDDALIEVIEALVRAHLIEPDHRGTHIRFVHALTREAIYEGVVSPRRRLWHLRIAESLERIPGADPDVIAFHFEHAGDPRAVDWLEQAADRARRAYAWISAADRLRTAASMVEDVPGQETRHRELTYRYAYLARFSTPELGAQALEHVRRFALTSGETISAAEVQFIRGILLCYADRFSEGIAEMKAGLRTIEELPGDDAITSMPMRLWTWNLLAEEPDSDPEIEGAFVRTLVAAGLDSIHGPYPWYVASAGLIREAVDIAERYTAAVRDCKVERGWMSATLAFANHALGICYAALGRPEDAQRAWAECRSGFLNVEHFAIASFAQLAEIRDVALTYGAADPGLRRRLAADAELTVARAGGAFRSGVSPRIAWLGCLTLDGQWDEVDRILGDLSDPGISYLRREITAARVTLARYRNDPGAVWREIHRELPAESAAEPGTANHQEALFLMRTASEMAIDAGDSESARAWLECHDRWLSWAGSELGRADGYLAWARWHHMAGNPEQARTHARMAVAAATAPAQPLVKWGAARLLGVLDLDAGHIGDARICLEEALAVAGSCEAPLLQALTLLDLARLGQYAGDASQVDDLLDQVDAIASKLGATILRECVADMRGDRPRPRLAEANASGLTAREIEVLGLLGRGMTDKEIAAALFISPYTASTHVKHLLTKLDVANRRAAALVAHEFGAT